jgi:hypothetical protein
MPYTDLTDEEYDALDEALTRTVPRFGPPGSDWLTRRVQIIDEMVLERVVAATRMEN